MEGDVDGPPEPDAGISDDGVRGPFMLDVLGECRSVDGVSGLDRVPVGVVSR